MRNQSSAIGRTLAFTLSMRYRRQRSWTAAAFAVAGVGMFASASTSNPVHAFVAICFAAIGFKVASSLFWPIPQS